MSYLPYVLDFERQQRMPSRYAMSFTSDTLFEAIDPSALEYFPKLSLFSGVRKPSKDRFEVYLDVEDYSPDDLRVKTVDGFVVVEGQHKEKREKHGWVQRHFLRRCPVPEGYKTEALLSQYSSDGTLTITANLVKSDEAKCDMPVTKKQEGEEKTSDKEPDQPESDQQEPDQQEPDQPEPDQQEPDQPEPDQPEPDQPEPDQPEPDQQEPDQTDQDTDGNQSEKKPVKSKPVKEKLVEVNVEVEELIHDCIYKIDDGVEIFLDEFKASKHDFQY